MNALEAAAVFAAGIGAGGINAVVGSGTLITFPTLVALGFPPVAANVSNNIGLVPGSVAGAYGYRAELAGQRDRLLRLAAASLTGAIIGAALLLGLPEKAFGVIVPVLIAVSLVLVVTQPRLNAWLAARREHAHPHGGPWLWAGVLAALVNGVAAVLFTAVWLLGRTEVDWVAVLLIALGATVGGLLGAKIGRRLPPMVLRGVIVAVGLTAIVNLITD